MCFDDFFRRYSGSSLKAVDILSKEHLKKTLFGDEGDEGMGDGREEFARIELAGEDVERLRVFAEVGDIEDGLGVWQVEAR